ncbi:hypothetical protein [Frankia sp. Cppng1_Ct_nod]|uniref:hypothetical protein n=1 Tax=Frankia sp. Cppng1_Ct_nod TaxID=2897162 RepID=UPI00104199FC|nr:hypothetical protein [Frankia sp. Cppng1_Ct_nod]
MNTTATEIVDLQGTKDYLSGLRGNIDQTVTGELETVLAGLANAGLTDPAVLGPIATLRELLSSARDGADAALAALDGGHSAVAETVAAVDAANDTEFYRQH